MTCNNMHLFVLRACHVPSRGPQSHQIRVTIFTSDAGEAEGSRGFKINPKSIPQHPDLVTAENGTGIPSMSVNDIRRRFSVKLNGKRDGTSFRPPKTD